MRYLINISLSFLLIIPFSGFSQRILSWQYAKELLIANNIDLKQGILKELVAKNNVDLARSDLYPNLTFGANNQHTIGFLFDPVSGRLVTGNQWSNYATASLNTSLIVYQGGQKRRLLEAENVNLDISKIDNKKLFLELELQLLSFYSQVLINRDLLTAARSQILLSAEQIKHEEIMLKIGKHTLMDLAQAKVKFANDNLNLVNIKNAFELSILKLKEILNINEAEKIDVEVPVEQEDQLLEQTFDVNKDPYIISIDKQLDLQDLRIKIAKSSYFPTVTFNGSYGTNYSSQRLNIFSGEAISFWDQLNQNRMLYGNLTLSFSIFDGFKTKNKINSLKLNKQFLLYEREKEVLNRKSIYTQSNLDYKAAEEEMKAVQATYEANKLNYEVINKRYEIGKSSSIDLYKAITEFNISEFKLITSKHKLFQKKKEAQIIYNWQQ